MSPVDEAVTDWLEVIRGEYLEIPGLCLTRPQIQRLWGLDSHECNSLVEALVSSRFLRRTTRDMYVRADTGR